MLHNRKEQKEMEFEFYLHGGGVFSKLKGKLATTLAGLLFQKWEKRVRCFGFMRQNGRLKGFLKRN